jgi:CRP/FNR family cyclic AMP-dependent transcriptional regulator
MNHLKFAWEPYLSLGQRRTYKQKTTLYHQGAIGSGFYYLHEGEVVIKLISSKGDERAIDIVSPGELFGEQGYRREPYFSSAVTNKPSTLYYFSNEAFHKLCQEHPGAANLFLCSLLNKERFLAEIVRLENCPVEQKMAFFLLRFCEKNHNNTICMNQTFLSTYVGTSRITVYKILRQWVKSGIVRISKRTIIIDDFHQLENILHGR